MPTPDEYLGYPLGERFTPHSRILDYFNELAKRSDLITMRQMGETYEHRPLMLATITSAKNRAALDEIRRNVASLANGTADANRAAEIAHTTPAIVWLGFGVHGNESSSAEAAMRVASTLLRDPDATKLLDDVVVLIDPLMNPDGRERYIEWFRRARGMELDPNPESYEHQEPWPGGRYNHYLIDMNRDWAWLSQQETKARVAAYREWNPQVFVDFHEMGYESSYFFPPDAKPINANLPKDVEKWLEVFGHANAAAFSQRGWPFFVAEEFDLFYPGYGDSWPSLHGAIGMTYEMAGHGRAGAAVKREDDSILTLRDRLERHYTTGMATVRTAAANREQLLRYTAEAARTQIESGRNTYLIEADSPNFDALVSLLRAQNIRVDMLSAPATVRATRVDRDAAESRTFAAGTAVVSTKQPLGGLAETLLEKTPQFTKGYLEEQRARTAADEPDQFYDLTTWSLPLAMNVGAWVTQTPVSGTKAYEPATAPAFKSAAYGYLVDAWSPNFYRLIGRLFAADIKFSVSDSDLNLGDGNHPRGSIVILKGNNAATLDATLAKVAGETNVSVVPLESGWVGGTAFGSTKLRYVKEPRIGLVGGPGTVANAFGMLWHTLDVDTPIPHSNLSAEALRNTDFTKFDVLVFPDGSYADRLGKRGLDRLKTWVNDGGVIVAIGTASNFLRDKDVDLSKIKPWEAPKKKDDDAKNAAGELYNDPRVPGAAFRTVMNDRSYLTFGLPRAPYVLIEGSTVYQPVAHKVDNIVTIDAKDPLVSGVAWPESLDRLKGAAYLVSEPAGNGQIITFADEPHFRLFWRGTLPLFLNAVIYSPSFPR
ncbi:MAG TPA: M14 metallopeptidase family protein [Thermoanaerobaculia bacterium]|nr:M14 metallopeptidase family protein [Thermoanaerobaculia bacterium]